MVQCKYFFWHQKETCLLENLQIQKGFWLCCASILFSMPSELKFIKWLRFFWEICTVKWVIFFSSFCWLLENLKLETNSYDVHCNAWTNIKKLHAQKNIFKKEFQITNFQSSIFWSNFRFLGTVLGRFSSNINEVIREVLNSLFFCKKISHTHTYWQNIRYKDSK